jgi:hypothetical protein
LLLLVSIALAGACSGLAGVASVPPATATPDADAVDVDSIDIQILESTVEPVLVIASGHLPDACSFVEQMLQTRQGNSFEITLSLARRADARCAQLPTSFEQTLHLEVAGLEAGRYTVTVNGVSDSFELMTDRDAPEPGTPDGPLALTWHRRGGIAGFCDDLAIYASGDVHATTCAGERVGQGRLSEEQLAQLQGWLAELQGFEWELVDGGTADGMATRLVFHGTGLAGAKAAERQAMVDLASQLSASLASGR